MNRRPGLRPLALAAALLAAMPLAACSAAERTLCTRQDTGFADTPLATVVVSQGTVATIGAAKVGVIQTRCADIMPTVEISLVDGGAGDRVWMRVGDIVETPSGERIGALMISPLGGGSAEFALLP